MTGIMWCLIVVGAFLVIYMLEECIDNFYPYLTVEDIETNGD